MKDNYSEMNVDMEQILFSKEYDELTAAEKEEIKDFISSKEDFYLMKNTLMSVKNSFGVEEEIEPRNSSKEDLLKMFNDTHGKVVSINKPRPFYLNPVFQIGIAAVLVLGIIFFYPKGENKNTTAMNEDTKENKEVNSKSSPEKDEAPSEEVSATETEEKSTLDELEKSEENLEESEPAVLADIPAKEDKPSANNFMFNKNETATAKGEGAYKYAETKNSADSVLYSEVNRSSSKKAKEKIVASDDIADGTVSNTSTTTTVTTGGVATDWDFASTKSEDKKESDKKKDGKFAHTNTAGGLYHQPAKPAADLKQGVSLKDQPALTEFLFTAL